MNVDAVCPDADGRVHATAVAIDGHGALLVGPAGAGKSDLALRLIDRGALLIADDQLRLMRSGAGIDIEAVAELSGRIDVAGVGICHVATTDRAPLALLVRVGPVADRYPLQAPTELLWDIAVPRVHLDPFHASAPIKVEHALRRNVP